MTSVWKTFFEKLIWVTNHKAETTGEPNAYSNFAKREPYICDYKPKQTAFLMKNHFGAVSNLFIRHDTAPIETTYLIYLLNSIVKPRPTGLGCRVAGESISRGAVTRYKIPCAVLP